MDDLVTLFSESTPVDPPQTTYARAVWEFMVPLALAFTPVLLGLISAYAITIIQFQLIGAVVAVAGLFFFCVVFRTFIRARDVIDMMYTQWEENQKAARNYAASRLALDIRVSGKGNTVSLTNNQQPNTNNLVVTADAAWFIKHLREFTQRANMLKSIGDGEGHERRHWLRSDGAVSDYRFEDGAVIGRPEYDQLIEVLDVRGRRKGVAGVVSTKGLGHESQPTQP